MASGPDRAETKKVRNSTCGGAREEGRRNNHTRGGGLNEIRTAAGRAGKRGLPVYPAWGVEPRSPKAGPGGVDEAREPAELAHAGQRPFVHDERGGKPEGHHVHQTVVLRAEIAFRVSKPRDPSVERVQDHGDENGQGGVFETPVHRLHDGIKSGKT